MLEKMLEEMREAGQAAFVRGAPSAPALDETYRKAIEGLQVGEGAAQMAKAWIDGWVQASLSSDEETNHPRMKGEKNG